MLIFAKKTHDMNIKHIKYGQENLIESEKNFSRTVAYPNHSNHRIVVNTLEKSPKAGYGSCRACDCKGYISKHNGSHECKNCNHHYDRHN